MSDAFIRHPIVGSSSNEIIPFRGSCTGFSTASGVTVDGSITTFYVSSRSATLRNTHPHCYLVGIDKSGSFTTNVWCPPSIAAISYGFTIKYYMPVCCEDGYIPYNETPTFTDIYDKNGQRLLSVALTLSQNIAGIGFTNGTVLVITNLADSLFTSGIYYYFICLASKPSTDYYVPREVSEAAAFNTTFINLS